MLIFLMGKQRSGKDTVADYLVDNYGFTKIALSKKVKELAEELFGMKTKDRGLLIDFGTKKMRAIDPDVWINQWRKVYRGLNPRPDLVVVPDVRFPNEYEFFKMHGGIAVRVKADPIRRSQRSGYDAEFEEDPTETMLQNYRADFTLYNNGPIEDLYLTVDLVMTKLLKGVYNDG